MAGKRSGDEFTAFARSMCVDALRVCVQIMNDGEAKSAERLRAAEIVIERACGKARTVEEPSSGGTLTVRFGRDADRFAK